MKAAAIEKLLKKHTGDEGKIDFAAVSKGIAEYTDTIIQKKMPDMDEVKKEVKGEAINEFVKKLGIKDVETQDQLTNHIKNNGKESTELGTENAKLTRELEEIRKEKESIESKYSEVNSKITNQEYKKTLKSLNFKKEGIEKALGAIKSKVKDGVTFEEAAKEFAEDEFNSTYLNEKNGKPYFGKNVDKDIPGEDIDQAKFEAAFKAGAGIKDTPKE